MKITIANLQKKTINQKLLKSQARKILRYEKVHTGELSLVLVTDCLIEKLNQKFLAKKYPTDVLAFELVASNLRHDRKSINGEIIISTDTAQRNARIFKTSFQYELTLYLAHGILHLLGFDDTSAQKSKLMRKKETELMKFLKAE